MKRQTVLWSILSSVICIPLFFLFSCSRDINLQQDMEPAIEPAPYFSQYISGYSGGIQSIKSSVTIELANAYPDAKAGEVITKSLFSFKPKVAGAAVWKDDHTIVFTPSESLESNKNYIVDFALGELYDVKSDLSTFKYSFRTLKAEGVLSLKDYTQKASDARYAELAFNLNLSDAIDMSRIDEFLVVKDNKGSKLPYQINAVNPKLYEVLLDSVERRDSARKIKVDIDGKSLGLSESMNLEFEVPPLDALKVLSTELLKEPSTSAIEGLRLTFSEALSTEQSLSSFLNLEGLSNYNHSVIDNHLNIYVDVTKLDSITVGLYAGLKSAFSNLLSKPYQQSIVTKKQKPSVKILSTGTILPNSKEQIISFSAQSLEYLGVRVVKVYGKNMLQLMQTYNLADESELIRVGRLILDKRISLKERAKKSLEEEQIYHLDLAPLFEQESGALYYIQLYFKPEYTTLPNFLSRRANLDIIKVEESLEDKESEWDAGYSYGLLRTAIPYDWQEYSWQRQNDPTHLTFYMEDSRVSTSTSVYSSKIGLSIKKNGANKLWAVVNDMLTTQPIQGASVKVYNYQMVEIADMSTDNDGFASTQYKGVPYFAVASHGDEKTYLKISTGDQLPVSRFDIGGVIPENGLKGFIYGERGVWRPGDDIHLTFMLEDRESRIPQNHPVSLELFNPKGQFYTKILATSHVNGVYYFKLKTNQQDPTGTWNAYVKLGGSTFHKPLMIESIKPNRLKINLDFQDDILLANHSVSAKLSSHWLMGALASNLEAKVEMRLTPIRSSFPKYDDYLFTNLDNSFTSGGVQTLFEGKLDGDGEAYINGDIPEISNAPGLLKAQITARVYEPGGDFSIHSQSMTLSPYSSYVGMKLRQTKSDYFETDSPIVIDAIRLDPKGKTLAGGRVNYKIYKLDWSWWYDQENLLTKYVNNSSVTPIDNGSVSFGTDGKSDFKFQINYPEYGRYLIYMVDSYSGHSVSQVVYVDWPSWRGRAERTNPEGETFLSFNLDKKEYKVGDMVELTLPGSSEGRALVSIENGSQILAHAWVEVHKDKDVKYKFKTTSEMTPNAYIVVSLLQPHAQTVNNLPIRMYGVEPLIVKDETTRLKPVVEAPKVVEPEKAFTVKVKEANKKQMTYTLALVDDGLLDLTSFKTPNPWDYFYSKEALGISTWDMYNNVIGALGALYSQKYRIGGDENLAAGDTKANRFNPVVKFLGPFTLKAGATAQHEITLPMYVGSIRTMVVASDGSAFGSADQNTIVRSPLMLIPSLPRVLSINDEVWVPVNLFVMEEGVKNVQVKLSTSSNIKVEGGGVQSLQFNKTGDQIVYFKIKVGKKVGIEKIAFEAKGNSFVAKQEVEIDVRNPNPLFTYVDAKVLGKNESYVFNTIKSADAEILKASVELSYIPPVNLTSRMTFLTNYSHSCTEQITSRALPLLYLKEFQDTKKMGSEEKIKLSVEGTIQELYSRQLSDGSFAYWPNESYSNPWASSYATFFLIKAKELGYNVNANALNRSLAYIASVTRIWSPSNSNWTYSSYLQAYNLFVLAIGNKADLASMNRLKEQKNLRDQTTWLLASAYAAMGKKDIANKLVFNISPSLSSYEYDYYGSEIRDDAFVLQALVLLDQKTKAFEVATRIANKLNVETYYQTQSTAMAIYTLGDYVKDMKDKSIDVSIQLGNKAAEKIKTPKSVYIYDGIEKSNVQDTKVVNHTENVVHTQFVEVLRLYNDTLPAVVDKDIAISVDYTDLDGKQISVDKMTVGQDFYAKVSVVNRRSKTISNIALTHILPSSWEVFQVLATEDGVESSRDDSNVRYQDIRDDRVLSYFDLGSRKTKTIKVRFHVTYAGTYVLPAVLAEVMYEPDVFSRTKASKITVSR